MRSRSLCSEYFTHLHIISFFFFLIVAVQRAAAAALSFSGEEKLECFLSVGFSTKAELAATALQASVHFYPFYVVVALASSIYLYL